MSQSQSAIATPAPSPLTTLTEDETMFRSSVREFAEGELRPRVEHMDEAAKLDPAIIKQCFELGLMGIETPEEFGGASANFFTAILAVEELSRVDASVGVFVDVQNDEIFVANFGNHSSTVYRRTASGDTPPIRTIRAAPVNAPPEGSVIVPTTDP